MQNVEIWREGEFSVRTNVARTVVWHSPMGFEFGYGGSGPADLALNILNAFVPPGSDGSDDECGASQFAWRHYQAFKREFIAPMDRAGGQSAPKS
jgi:hypothetical protein